MHLRRHHIHSCIATADCYFFCSVPAVDFTTEY